MLSDSVRRMGVWELFAFGASLVALRSFTAAAQTTHGAIPTTASAVPGHTSAGKTHIDTASDSGVNCPVQFSASRWGSGTVENTRGGAAGAEQRGLLLHLRAMGGDRGVVQATVLVHGSPFHPHVAPAGNSAPGTLTETFHLAGAERDAHGDWKLTTDQVPMVQEVDIVALRFADGTA